MAIHPPTPSGSQPGGQDKAAKPDTERVICLLLLRDTASTDARRCLPLASNHHHITSSFSSVVSSSCGVQENSLNQTIANETAKLHFSPTYNNPELKQPRLVPHYSLHSAIMRETRALHVAKITPSPGKCESVDDVIRGMHPLVLLHAACRVPEGEVKPGPSTTRRQIPSLSSNTNERTNEPHARETENTEMEFPIN